MSKSNAPNAWRISSSTNNVWPQSQFNNGFRPQTPVPASQPLSLSSNSHSNVQRVSHPLFPERLPNQMEQLCGRSPPSANSQHTIQAPPNTGPPLQNSSQPPNNLTPSLQLSGPPPTLSVPPPQLLGTHPHQLSLPPQHQVSIPQLFPQHRVVGLPAQFACPPPQYTTAHPHQPGPSKKRTVPPPQHPGPSQQRPGSSQQYPSPPQQYTGPSQQHPGPSQQYPGQSQQHPVPSQQHPGSSRQYWGTLHQHLGPLQQGPGVPPHPPGPSHLHSGPPPYHSTQHKPPPLQHSGPPPQHGWQSQHKGSFPTQQNQPHISIQNSFPRSSHGTDVSAAMRAPSQFTEAPPRVFPSMSQYPPVLGKNAGMQSVFPASENIRNINDNKNQYASTMSMTVASNQHLQTTNVNISSDGNNIQSSSFVASIKAENDSVLFSGKSVPKNVVVEQVSNNNSEGYYTGSIGVEHTRHISGVKLETESDYGSVLPHPSRNDQQNPVRNFKLENHSHRNRPTDNCDLIFQHVKSENNVCESTLSFVSQGNQLPTNQNNMGHSGRETILPCTSNIKMEIDRNVGPVMPVPISNEGVYSHSLSASAVNTYTENRVFISDTSSTAASIQQNSTANTLSYVYSTSGETSWQYAQSYSGNVSSNSFDGPHRNENYVAYTSSRNFQEESGNKQSAYDYNNDLAKYKRERERSPRSYSKSRTSQYNDQRRSERGRRGGSPYDSAGSNRKRSRSRHRSTSRRRSRSRSSSRKYERPENSKRGSKYSPETSRKDSVSDSKRYARRSVSRTRSISRGYRSSSRKKRSISRTRSSRHADRHSSDSDDSRSHTLSNSSQLNTERDNVLKKYRKNYCANSNDMQSKLLELAKMTPDEVIEQEKKVWTRTAPADLFYARDAANPKIIIGKPKLLELCKLFKEQLVDRAERVRLSRPKYEPPPRKNRAKVAKHKSEICSSSDSSNDESSTDEEDCTMEEMERKRLHPHRLHQELWFNDPGEMNDGPLCRCSARARRCGIRHGIYAGEKHLVKCDINSNNGDKLYHYRITISPPTNFLTKTPTIINHDEHEFIFEGFSMFSHYPLEKLPTCKVIRFNIEYTILYIEETIPENFTIEELELFHQYLFKEILELVDLDFRAYDDTTGCPLFHFMPRFVRDLSDNGKEILSMNEVLQYLLNSNRELIKESQLKDLLLMPQYKWQNFADEIKGMVVTYPGMKPCALRVDQLDRNQQGKKKPDLTDWPEIVHFGIRPPQLSYAGNPDYQKAWREYVKYRHLIANMPKPSFEDKRKLEAKENKLQEMRTLSRMKRDVTVAVKSTSFFCTGIMCDIVQHAMLIPVLVCHLRFHRSCNVLETDIGYKFENRYLLQLALTHPSYRENFGTNPDHARNSLTNCGIRQPEYGDRRIHYMNTRKRGINTLINIMSRFGKKTETESNITHNERLEFLGDAVVEFLTSIHLFHMFPDLEEGGLATYRAAIVQNQHLAVLAKRLKLEEYMLYAHGSDLCHDLELRHAMANCFEALMGALFLDGGIEVADKVFGETLFKEREDLLDVWVNYPPHPLQEQEPLGDRKWIPHFELLQKLTEFEKSTNIEFTHIRLLARAFTDRSIGYTNLTLGSNQRLEFLGDTVLQLIASEYLYKFFPEHHEGHLSLLRSSLVNNRTQAVVCDDLAMTNYALYANPKGELKTKDRADLLEAFLGALYVDKDLEYCHVFCHVCFFPRLQDFIMNQDWNDPKSKLQQCCLTLRTMDGGEPDIPIYKVIECKGPTNTRVYTVAVYFQNRRLAAASGHSIQQAEMNAAKQALDLSQELFPQLDHQKRVIAKSMRKQKWPNRSILRGKTSKTTNGSEQNENSEQN